MTEETQIEVQPEVIPDMPSYKYHRPAQKKYADIPVPNPIDAILLEDLPIAWERKCYVGGIEYVTVTGQSFKDRVRRPGFKKGDHITLINLTFYPGIGALYGFREGLRGGFAVRSDQVSFSDANMSTDTQDNSSVSPELSGGIGDSKTEER